MKGMVISMAKPRKLTEEMVQRIREMYSTREFTNITKLNEILSEMDVLNMMIWLGYDESEIIETLEYDFAIDMSEYKESR